MNLILYLFILIIGDSTCCHHYKIQSANQRLNKLHSDVNFLVMLRLRFAHFLRSIYSVLRLFTGLARAALMA